MTVKELIETLSPIDPDTKVMIVYDGEPRIGCGYAYLAKSGRVMLVGPDEVVYNPKHRPIDVTDDPTNRYWHTPDDGDKASDWDDL